MGELWAWRGQSYDSQKSCQTVRQDRLLLDCRPAQCTAGLNVDSKFKMIQAIERHLHQLQLSLVIHMQHKKGETR